MIQGISRAIGLAGRYLSAFAPRGTPARPAKNIVEGKTRGERKQAARQLVKEAILAEYASRPRSPLELIEAYSVDPATAKEHVDRYRKAYPHVVEVFRLGDEIIAEPALTMRVVEFPEGFLVLDEDGLQIAGPYKDRKTANRRMRQLGG